MKRLFYLFVSLVVVVGLCICTSCKKTEEVEEKQEVTKTEEVQKSNVTTPAVEEAVPEEVEEKQEVTKTEEVQKSNVTTPAVEEAVPEEKATTVTAAADLTAGEEVYKKKGMCVGCHGADGSKPFKLTKLFTGKDYTVKEQEEWIEKEAQMKFLKGKLTKQDLINVNAYLNTLKK
jgi:mono/diheme cytochrome c family protein